MAGAGAGLSPPGLASPSPEPNARSATVLAALASTRAKKYANCRVRRIEITAFEKKSPRMKTATRGRVWAVTAGRVNPPNSITRLESLPRVMNRAIEVARKPIARIPTRSKKNKEYFTRNFILEKYPITLLDGKIPTKRIADRLNSHIYEKHIKSGDMSNMIFKLESISNIKFSSNLAYKFDYSIH